MVIIKDMNALKDFKVIGVVVFVVVSFVLFLLSGGKDGAQPQKPVAPGPTAAPQIPAPQSPDAVPPQPATPPQPPAPPQEANLPPPSVPEQAPSPSMTPPPAKPQEEKQAENKEEKEKKDCPPCDCPRDGKKVKKEQRKVEKNTVREPEKPRADRKDRKTQEEKKESVQEDNIKNTLKAYGLVCRIGGDCVLYKDGNVLRAGDRIGDHTIKSISPGAVELEKDGQVRRVEF